MSAEWERVDDSGDIEDGTFRAGPWHQWGPYLAERAWGGVREDYSADGDAWRSFPYEHARSRAFRWNEDGMAGISDIHQDLCLALALWNGRDSHLKERMFGLTGPQGNHGEDAKEYWWYLDATPSHSWLRWRYHYPQAAFPYDDLVTTNAARSRTEPEYELLDTGVFDDDRYWVVEVAYAKAGPTDIAMRVRVTNAGPDADRLHVLPTLWFRDTWSWGQHRTVPSIDLESGRIVARHHRLGAYELLAAPAPSGVAPTPLFCENTTNTALLYGSEPATPFPKDGINDHVVAGAATVNPADRGTKAAWWYTLDVPAGETVELRLMLSEVATTAQPRDRAGWAGAEFDGVLALREREADEFYDGLARPGTSPAEALVMRQAFAGMIWGKQFYRYDVSLWLDGDPGEPAPPSSRLAGRNHRWRTLDAHDVISMPDPWEYPWFAAWDLAFHTVTLAFIDPAFAKYQLLLMLREWYSHPNGAIPAYEWNFDDVNPPVHAWAALVVFIIDGGRDRAFLVRAFTKLLMNFTWWMNRVDADGNNVFEGGFLGLDNIGPINRSALPPGYRLEQSDGTGWMAFYSLAMLGIALTLAEQDDAYVDLALRFFEHFALISRAVTAAGMWDTSDGFFYDQLVRPDGRREPIRCRSLVGVLPVLASAAVDGHRVRNSPRLQHELAAFLQRSDIRVDALAQVGLYQGDGDTHGLMSLIDPERLRRVLAELLDENGMLGPTGIRSVSKRHKAEPVTVTTDDGAMHTVDYEPAESTTEMYGGNSNWRGPVWFPLNILIIEALHRFHRHLGDDYRVEMPTGSGRLLTLAEVADDLQGRLVSTFLPGPDGRRPVFGDIERLQTDPRWNDAVMFFEYFDGDTGAGLGASHQTGWTGLVATLLARPRGMSAPPTLS